jgi:ubiquinone/menaquinone biosynthesis C-methylase UbiE
MSRNESHALLVSPTQDEGARQRFALGLKRTLGRRLRPLRRVRFEQKRAACESPEAVEAVMREDPVDRFWQALNRDTQERMWAAVAAPLEREEQRLAQQFRDLSAEHVHGGTLRLDPGVATPSYLKGIAIHLQPGGYTLDRSQDDVIAGALYEAGGAIYSAGAGIGVGQSKAEIVSTWLAQRFPGFAPRRILDIGTSAGASATPYAQHFKGAEVHAIDVCPGLLRYAHARAEALGVAVHFRQMAADRLDFPDDFFDFVVSHNLMHEMPPATTAGMFRECARVLAPGGITVHQDVPLRYAGLSAFEKWDYGWDRDHNNEPFWLEFAAADVKAMLQEAGFMPAEVFETILEQADGSMRWFVVGARKGLR